ncbi:hypothetical protein K8R47_03395 [archaeon]|nr:hypothetical protein [archaeon]
MKYLKYNKEKIKLKDFLIFFSIILVPNFLRQLVYIITKSSTGSVDFILSPETQELFLKGTIGFGFVEEMIIGLVFAILWFKFRKLKWFAYGWIGDALIDFVFVFIWFTFGVTLFSGLNYYLQVFIRELLLGYIILGSFMFYKKVDIRLWSLITIILGILLILFLI